MLTHVDKDNRPTMVDVSEKTVTFREAEARSKVILPENILSQLVGGEIQSKKGPVFQTAQIAGTMAAKKTSDLIPFCHPLMIESCKLNIGLNDQREVEISCKVRVYHKTGVEMEALTGVTVAALTIYDMCKAMSHDIVIQETLLVQKTGGKSDVSRV